MEGKFHNSGVYNLSMSFPLVSLPQIYYMTIAYDFTVQLQEVPSPGLGFADGRKAPTHPSIH